MAMTVLPGSPLLWYDGKASNRYLSISERYDDVLGFFGVIEVCLEGGPILPLFWLPIFRKAGDGFGR